MTDASLKTPWATRLEELQCQREDRTIDQPRREEFILDARRAVRTWQKPNAHADSDTAHSDAIANILRRPGLWLSPKVVEHYHPDDFLSWQKEQQDRLRSAVEAFREIASHARQDQPLTVEQFTEGAQRFRELINVLGGMVRDEWLQAIETVEKQVEEWSAEAEWRSRRVNKTISESLISTYVAPQLLIFAEPNLYVLDPVARFTPGGQGSFDFAIQPSYDTTSLYRDAAGTWFVHLDINNGVSKGRRVEWSRDAFRQCIEQLRVLV